MNKVTFSAYMQQSPQKPEEKYIFLVSTVDLSEAICSQGFRSVAILPPDQAKPGYFTSETFAEEIRRQSYGGAGFFTYVLSCSTKKANTDLQALLEGEQLEVVEGWRLFRDRDFLRKEQFAGELRTALRGFIERFEGKPQKTVGEKAKCPDLVETLDNMKAASNFDVNDKGNGRLFAEIFKDKHRYNSDRKEFMLFDGKRWVDDAEGMSARASAKELSDALLTYAVSGNFEGDKTEYLKAVTSLVNIRNRNNMLQDSKDVYYITNEDLDKNDYILNVSNGVLDLTSNEPKFMEHDADALLSKICNVAYDPAATCETWLKFLDDVMQGDKGKIKYLQKIAGISLTGNTQEETMFILYGNTTRNGKSTFCETLIYMLGDYAIVMRPESLAVKQNLDSRQASGDIARLDGCRFVNASEPPKRMLFDTALLKSLLGRDSITARHLHQREFTFIPKFKLVMNTNYLPSISDDTVFSSGRINVISFDRHFKPQEQDKTLKQKLRSKKELSGILNWCIEGLRSYREEGLIPPQAVQTATNTYRNDSDKIGNFLNECMLKQPGKSTKAKDVYEVYEKWCNDNGYGVENKSHFNSELKSKNIFAATGTIEGKTVRNVVKGYVISEDEFVDIQENSESPFD